MKFAIHILNIALSKQNELYSMCKYYAYTYYIIYYSRCTYSMCKQYTLTV